MGGGWAKWQCQWPFQPGAMQLAGCGIAGLSSASAQVEEWKKEKSDEENPASVTCCLTNFSILWTPFRKKDILGQHIFQHLLFDISIFDFYNLIVIFYHITFLIERPLVVKLAHNKNFPTKF